MHEICIEQDTLYLDPKNEASLSNTFFNCRYYLKSKLKKDLKFENVF